MKVVVQDLIVNYRDEGAGEAILFLHGWQDNLHTFNSLIPFLPSWRLIRLDLPGFGGTEAPKRAWDLNDYVRFVEDFIKKIDLRVDIIIGHSFGGRIIIKGAERFCPRKVVLISSAGIAKRRTLRNSVLKLLTKIGSLITYIPPLIFYREKIKRKFYSSIGSDYLEAGSLKETFLKIISENLEERAKLMQLPTLLIWGSDDKETPLSEGERLSVAIPNLELRVIKGAGHFVHRERPDEVAGLIKEFI